MLYEDDPDEQEDLYNLTDRNPIKKKNSKNNHKKSYKKLEYHMEFKPADFDDKYDVGVEKLKEGIKCTYLKDLGDKKI